MSLNDPNRPTIRVILSFAVIWLVATPPYILRQRVLGIERRLVDDAQMGCFQSLSQAAASGGGR